MADYTDKFNTKLNDEDEKKYLEWIKSMSKIRGRDVSKDLYDYDMRGYWLNGGYADNSKSGHFTDTYKKPNHMTFSSGSKYHGAKDEKGNVLQGGSWSEDGTSFTPSSQMMDDKLRAKALIDYMQKYEKGVKLNY